MIAHVGGVPIEELLPSVTTTGAGVLLLGRAWVLRHLRRRRDPGRADTETLGIEGS